MLFAIIVIVDWLFSFMSDRCFQKQE